MASPVITVVSPTPSTAPGAAGGFSADSATARATAIIIDVTDDVLLSYLTVTNTLTGEWIYRSSSGLFGTAYVGSTAAAITGGKRLTILPAAKWPTSTNFVQLTVDAVDNTGGVTSQSYVWDLPAPVTVSAPVVAPVAGARDHVAIALGRLPQQFKDATKLQAFISAFMSESQALENAMQDLLTQRTLDNAVGAQLDVIGKIVGQARGGLSDTDYRRYCRARIAANRSNGVPEDLIKVAEAAIADVAAKIILNNSGVASLIVRVASAAADDATANAIFDLLEIAVSAGVRFVLETQYTADSDTWMFAQAAFLSGNTAIGDTNLPVGSTAGFPSTGTLNVDEGLATADLGVTYSGVDSTNFLNVSGLAHTHSTSACVTLADASVAGLGMGDTSNSNVGGELISARDAHYP